MISVKKINEKNFEILIKPNSSLNGWQRVFFLLSIFILCGGIAVIFYFVGATMILPFAGIELAAVFFAFYLNFKWSEQKELVTLSLEHVVVEKGRNQKEYTWKEFRTFTAIGQREDLSNTIYSIAPTETPVVSSIGKTKATAIYHEWQTDALEAPGSSRIAEGQDWVAPGSGAQTPATSHSNKPSTQHGPSKKSSIQFSFTHSSLLFQIALRSTVITIGTL